MVRQLIHDFGVDVSHRDVGYVCANDLDDPLNARVFSYYIVNAAVVERSVNHKHYCPNRIVQIQIGTILIKGRPPNCEWLMHYSLPTELINGCVKAHPHRSPKDRSEATDHEPQVVGRAQILQQSFSLQLGIGVWTLWL
jgi:hypothetical protein